MPTRPDGKPYLPPGEATRIARKAAEGLAKGTDNTGYTVAPINPLVRPGATISAKELGLTPEELKKLNQSGS